MRISKEMLERKVRLIESYTNHKVTLHFTTGCGTTVTIDGIEYGSVYNKKQDAYNGVSNKKIYEILEPYYREAINKYREAIHNTFGEEV